MFYRNNDRSSLNRLALFVIPIAMVVRIIANGLAVSVLWGWFVVPIFDDQNLTIPQAIGLLLLLRFITSPDKDSESKEEKSINEWIIYLILFVIARPGITLAVGYILHLLM